MDRLVMRAAGIGPVIRDSDRRKMFDRDNREARADVASRRTSEWRGEGDSGVVGEGAAALSGVAV